MLYLSITHADISNQINCKYVFKSKTKILQILLSDKISYVRLIHQNYLSFFNQKFTWYIGTWYK